MPCGVCMPAIGLACTPNNPGHGPPTARGGERLVQPCPATQATAPSNPAASPAGTASHAPQTVFLNTRGQNQPAQTPTGRSPRPAHVLPPPKAHSRLHSSHSATECPSPHPETISEGQSQPAGAPRAGKRSSMPSPRSAQALTLNSVLTGSTPALGAPARGQPADAQGAGPTPASSKTLCFETPSQRISHHHPAHLLDARSKMVDPAVPYSLVLADAAAANPPAAGGNGSSACEGAADFVMADNPAYGKGKGKGGEEPPQA